MNNVFIGSHSFIKCEAYTTLLIDNWQSCKNKVKYFQKNKKYGRNYEKN